MHMLLPLLACLTALALPDDTDAQAQELIKKQTADNNAKWKAQIEAKLKANPRLKALSDRYGYRFIHSKSAFKNDTLNWCAYSLSHNTGEEAQHQGDVHLIFGNSNADAFDVNPRTTCANLIVDLGEADIAKDVDPRQVNIAAERGWAASAKAVENHVYLIRVRDDAGSRFFVLLQPIHVDPKNDYVAFVYRMLDGKKLGLPEDKIVKRSGFKS